MGVGDLRVSIIVSLVHSITVEREREILAVSLQVFQLVVKECRKNNRMLGAAVMILVREQQLAAWKAMHQNAGFRIYLQ